MQEKILGAVLLAALLPTGCKTVFKGPYPHDFDGDVAFLKHHTEVVVLDSGSGQRVVVVPAWQGRVMTSTAGGFGKESFGWTNYDLVRSGKVQPHINAYGGEDRFWLGPEAGQYALFFEPGDPFDLDHWQTPAVIDTTPWPVVHRSATAVTFLHEAVVRNYASTFFVLEIERTVRLLSGGQLLDLIGILPGQDVRWVAYESENVVRNRGTETWTQEGGLLSIWILGMFKPSPATTVVVPYRSGPDSELGPVVNDAYFGEVPEERLAIGEEAIFFKADGQQRSKIGVNPRRALPVLGSWDAQNGVLTIVHYDLSAGEERYVNSLWEVQEDPYAGDAVNSYNDGPPEPGKPPLGPFYELETSSPALALPPGGEATHHHRTVHFTGPRAELNAIAERVLRVSLGDIEAAFR